MLCSWPAAFDKLLQTKINYQHFNYFILWQNIIVIDILTCQIVVAVYITNTYDWTGIYDGVRHENIRKNKHLHINLIFFEAKCWKKRNKALQRLTSSDWDQRTVSTTNSFEYTITILTLHWSWGNLLSPIITGILLRAFLIKKVYIS